jgi:hypothetical protein
MVAPACSNKQLHISIIMHDRVATPTAMMTMVTLAALWTNFKPGARMKSVAASIFP